MKQNLPKYFSFFSLLQWGIYVQRWCNLVSFEAETMGFPIKLLAVATTSLYQKKSKKMCQERLCAYDQEMKWNRSRPRCKYLGVRAKTFKMQVSMASPRNGEIFGNWAAVMWLPILQQLYHLWSFALRIPDPMMYNLIPLLTHPPLPLLRTHPPLPIYPTLLPCPLNLTVTSFLVVFWFRWLWSCCGAVSWHAWTRDIWQGVFEQPSHLMDRQITFCLTFFLQIVLCNFPSINQLFEIVRDLLYLEIWSTSYRCQRPWFGCVWNIRR